MSKYGAIKAEVDGITFASRKEARRYGELKLLERGGQIRDLRLQPRYPLTVNDQLVCTYVADFAYSTASGGAGIGKTIVEDAKGFKTPEYKLKAKLFRAVFGFPITEV
jgi:hypothetical protein